MNTIINRYCCLLCLLCVLSLNVDAQDTSALPAFKSYNVYRLKPKKEIILLGSGVVISTTALLLPQTELTPEDLLLLDRNNVPNIDRVAIDMDSASAMQWRTISDYSNYVTWLSPAILAGAQLRNRNSFFTTSLQYGEAFLLTVGTTELLKRAVHRTRPYAYNTDYASTYRLDKDEAASFPSMHTSTAALNTFFTAAIIDHLYIDRNNIGARIALWSGAAVIPAFVGYGRIRGSKHFPTDVLTGYLIGAAAGIGIPALHEMKIGLCGMGLHAYVFPTGQTGIGMRYQF